MNAPTSVKTDSSRSEFETLNIGFGYVRFGKPQSSLARCCKQDPGPQGEARETSEKSYEGCCKDDEELSAESEITILDKAGIAGSCSRFQNNNPKGEYK